MCSGREFAQFQFLFIIFCFNIYNIGDFNALPDHESIEYLLGNTKVEGKTGGFKDAWTQAQKKKATQLPENDPSRLGYSFPTWKPEKRIDFFLLNGDIDVKDIYLIGNTTLPANAKEADLIRTVSSDHLGLAALLYPTHLDAPKK